MKSKHILPWIFLLFCSFTQAQETLSPDFFRKHTALNGLKNQQAIVLPELEREGCEFLEWNTKEDGTGKSYKPGEKFTPDGDTTLYAI